MDISNKKLDKLYKEWSGVDHTVNSNIQTHDSSECMDFAWFCLKFSSYYDKEDMEDAFRAGNCGESFENWIKEYDSNI